VVDAQLDEHLRFLLHVAEAHAYRIQDFQQYFQQFPRRIRRNQDIAIPRVAVRPVSGLDAPHHPTYQCQIGGCGWIGQNTKRIREHCKDEHGWMNPRLAGRPHKHTKPGRHESTPWIPVASQQFVHRG
jgi:hypothetical protein